MYAAALGAGVHEGGQGKGRSASQAERLQPAAGHDLLSETAPMGLINKFNQFKTFSKRPACTVAVTASAISHRCNSLFLRVVRFFFVNQGYAFAAPDNMTQVKS